MFRDAGNYKAGKRTTVPFSQYTKYNLIGGRSLTLLVNPNIKNTSEEDYAEYFNLKEQ